MKANTATLLCALTLLTATTLTLTVGAQAANSITVVHAFSARPAYFPVGGLVADSSGNLYGTTALSNDNCSNSGCGTVFKLTPQAGGGWRFSSLHQFTGPDGQQPSASLVFDASGNLYGTTAMGGANGLGTVFELLPSGEQWKEKVLYSFGATQDDIQSPFGSLTMDAAGNLYGTAANGGTSRAGCGGPGCGGVFELNQSGIQWKEMVIYNFTGTQDGGNPLANLIFDAAGNLYGTAGFGGGVVFALSPSIGGSWTETTLYTFTTGTDGGSPRSGLIFDSAGNLYGTTYTGGNALCNGTGCGTVFKLAPHGGNWALSTLFAFDASNGGWPSAGVVSDSAGNL